MSETTQLSEHLICEQLDDDLYRGHCRDFGGDHVFGGQTMAQAISVAHASVQENRNIHSMHANFIRPGTASLPVHYHVERSRDGKNYSSRRIVASQNERDIIHFTVSLRDDANESGIYKKRELPPFALDIEEGEFDTFNRNWHDGLIETRILLGKDSIPPNTMQTWVKPKDKLSGPQSIHSALLAYFSDIGLLPCNILLLEQVELAIVTDITTSYMMSSLNHAIWFHRPFKADEWLFFECIPEYTASDRGMAHGRFYTPDGTLVASASQEGMFRRFKK